MTIKFPLVLRIVCAFLLAASASEQATAQDADVYAAPETWLCKPGRQDLCSADIATTVIRADGSTTRTVMQPDSNAPVDCFYVYPTISNQQTGNSNLVPGPGEQRVVVQQFARFATVCKPYAPMYRQVTLAGLTSALTGSPMAMDFEMGYQDVLAAWKHYLKYDNHGRGIVLVGHSQGARVLQLLVQREIENAPVQAQLVSAVMLGFNVEVPIGAKVGGTFKRTPLCSSAEQNACVVSFVSFRAESPPPANTRFGLSRSPGMQIGCVDPAQLSGMPPQTTVPARSNLLGQPTASPEWQRIVGSVDTAFITLPDYLQDACVADGGRGYLAISSTAEPNDVRPKHIPGDLIVGGKTWDDWGLHLVDFNLGAGNLVEIVRRQAAFYVAGKR
jgi:hypothetical protein